MGKTGEAFYVALVWDEVVFEYFDYGVHRWWRGGQMLFFAVVVKSGVVQSK